MTYEDLSKQLNTSVQSIQNLVQVLSAAFADMEDGGSGEIEYTTEERVIGKWIDGKPLYQITVNVTNPVNDSNENLIDLATLNIDECPYLYGYAIRHSGDNIITYYVNSIDTADWYYFKARYDNFRNSIMYTCLFKNDSIDRMRFTIQYTKTTD